MTIAPIPVTFHVRAEPRPDLIDAPRRAQPYRLIVQAVGLMAALAAGFAYFAGSMLPAPRSKLVATPGTASSPQPSFPVWRPQPQESMASAASPEAPAADYTPVGSIRDRGAPRASAFSPVERAPDYAGFRVIAGK